jgi:hypothetical protein
MFAFLGLLLFGIGLASGLIPLHRRAPQPEVAPIEVVAPTEVMAPPHPEKPETVLRSPTPRPSRPVLAKAPCANPDTSAAERLLREDKAADPARLAAAACEASMGYQSASPDTMPPETAAVNPSSAEPIFITPYDSIAH